MVPWRIAIPLASHPQGAFHLSLFDVFAPFLLLRRSDLPLLATAARRRGAEVGLLALFLLAALAGLSARPLPVLFTCFAVAAGVMPALLDDDSLPRGLRSGMALSAGLTLPLFLAAPEFVTEGGRFCGLLGTKNGLAFLAGFLCIDALRRSAEAPKSLYEAGGWFALVSLTGSRGAMFAAALASVLPAGTEGTRRGPRLVLSGAFLLAAAGIIAYTGLPADRLYFAESVALWCGSIPLLGIGAGSGFGLDLFFKTWLEFGWIGGGALVALVALALRRRPSPELAFILLFGLAHDSTRWPVFWYLLLRNRAEAR